MSEERPFPGRVAEVRDEKTIVINRGNEDNVKKGDSFIVYSLGDEIIDPDTKESLGRLEIVKGKAVVEHVQDCMATLISSKTIMPDKKVVYRYPNKINTSFASLFSLSGAQAETKEEIIGKTQILPFDNVQVGDFVKPI